jgi:hypothetical protein
MVSTLPRTPYLQSKRPEVVSFVKAYRKNTGKPGKLLCRAGI